MPNQILPDFQRLIPEDELKIFNMLLKPIVKAYGIRDHAGLQLFYKYERDPEVFDIEGIEFIRRELIGFTTFLKNRPEGYQPSFIRDVINVLNVNQNTYPDKGQDGRNPYSRELKKGFQELIKSITSRYLMPYFLKELLEDAKEAGIEIDGLKYPSEYVLETQPNQAAQFGIQRISGTEIFEKYKCTLKELLSYMKDGLSAIDDKHDKIYNTDIIGGELAYNLVPSLQKRRDSERQYRMQEIRVSRGQAKGSVRKYPKGYRGISFSLPQNEDEAKTIQNEINTFLFSKNEVDSFFSKGPHHGPPSNIDIATSNDEILYEALLLVSSEVELLYGGMKALLKQKGLSLSQADKCQQTGACKKFFEQNLNRFSILREEHVNDATENSIYWATGNAARDIKGGLYEQFIIAKHGYLAANKNLKTNPQDLYSLSRKLLKTV